MFSFRGIAVLVLACLMTACGGGGGGGGGSSSGGGTPPPPPLRGTFTLSGTTANFAAIQGVPFPAPQNFALTITGIGVATVGAGYSGTQTPANWLSVGITGSGTSYTLSVQPIVGMVGPGTHTATFTVGTADTAGTILQTQTFTVTFQLDAPLRFAETQTPMKQYIFGDTTRTEDVPLVVNAANRSWTVKSNATWLRVPAATQTGNATITATIDITGLAPGYYFGAVDAANSANSVDSSSHSFSIYVRAAEMSVTQDALMFGGANGLAPLDALPVQFSISTGQGIHPFTINLSTDSGGSWLHVDRTTGVVGAAGASVSVSVERGQLRGRTYTGELRITTDVYGSQFNEVIPVTFNAEANRLVVSSSGVALSRVPGRDVLTRTLKVFSTLRSTSTQWTAVSNSPWLAVTGSGLTGGDLVLTATPGALALDTTHFAEVTITSPDSRVENQQTVRVGLFSTNTAPVLVTKPHVNVAAVAASPVEPVVAVTDNAGLHLYNVYSGALVRELAVTVPQTRSMKFSEDGRSLFVYGAFNLNVLELDASNGNVLHTYESNANPNYPLPGSAIAVMHPNGDPILVTPWGLVYGLRTREELPHLTPFSIPYNAMSFAVSPDQSLLLPHWGTPSRVTLSALDGGGLRSEWPAVDSAFGSDSADSCVAAAGDRLYISHSSNESRVAGVSVATAQLVQSLPTNNRWANSLQCVWNGLLVVGLSDYYGPIDMRVFNGPTGVELATLSSDGTGPGNPNWNYRDLERFGLAVSADGTRVFSAWENSPGIIESGYAIQTLPAP